MGYMFNGASAFNQNIGAWSTSRVVDMSYMFCGATAFDQSLASGTLEMSLTWTASCRAARLAQRTMMRRSRRGRARFETWHYHRHGPSKYSQATAARTAILNKYTGAYAITINDGGFIDEVVTTTASANVAVNTPLTGSLVGDATSTGAYA